MTRALSGERREVEVARGRDQLEADRPELLERGARPRMRGEDDSFLEPVEPLDDPGEPFGSHVRLPVNRDEDVPARLEPEPLERLGALRRDRREEPVDVCHHVADHEPLARDAFALELPGRALVRAEEQLRDPVDRDPIALLRHREVEATKPRLDVRERRRARRLGARERRVRVAEDEHPVGLLGRDRLADRRPHRVRVGGLQPEPVPRRREPELLEEDVRELPVVVLPRVQHDLLDPRLAQAPRTPAPT